MKIASIRFRLLIGYGMVLFVIIALFAAALVLGLRHSFNTQIQHGLHNVVLDIKHDVLTNPPKETKQLDTNKKYALSPVFIEVWEVRDGEPHQILYSSNMKGVHLPLDDIQTDTFIEISIPLIQAEENEFALLSSTFVSENRQYMISVATPYEEVEDIVEKFTNIVLLFGTLLYFFALFLGMWLIGKVLLPMKTITKAAASISQADLSRRVPLPAIHDEFYTLAETFNTMLDRIEKAFEKMKLFNANVSHELKTPLTIIRGEAEVALRKKRDPEVYEEVLTSITDEIQSMQEIIDGMLIISSSDQKFLSKTSTPILLDALIKRVYVRQKPFADAKGVDICLGNLEPIEIQAEARLMEEALNNLVDNAIKYTPAGKKVMIALQKKEGLAQLVITDEGIGIHDENLSKLFDPFWREDTAHSKKVPGHGLSIKVSACKRAAAP